MYIKVIERNGTKLNSLSTTHKMNQYDMNQWPSYRPFCPKFRCHGNGDRSGVNINDTVKLADPENHTLKPKITTLSYT